MKFSRSSGFDGSIGQLSLWSHEPPDHRWRVRVSARARRMTIRVFAGGRVEIAVPKSARPGAIERFVGQHREWIERKIVELGAQPTAATALPERIDFAATGESFAIHWHTSVGAPRWVAARDGLLELTGDRNRSSEARALLRRWLIQHARESLSRLLETLARDTGMTFQRIQVRRQRTRWGSCSRSGTISLNCCLLFQQPAVVRYLLVHELCHTRQMNHSSRFWHLVMQHQPDYRRLDRELVRGWRHVPGWVFGP